MTKKTTHAKDSDVERKLFGALSYISILCIIPLLFKRDNHFVHDHAKQGLGLFVLEVIVGALSKVVGWIPVIGSLTNFAAWALGVFFFIVSIIGIIKVLSDKPYTVPLIGATARRWHV
ncbi:DUF4870 domain-containing protein [Candidatus Woesearchaeota archaeon]|nr:DUF4870 domain-containing protein [Candidatus Woesearchaeota archaeon]